MNTGAWSEEETRIFLDAMESAWLTMKPMLANNTGKDMYQMDDGLIIWGNISKAMGYRRSRQQCADKWRKIVRQVMIMRANGQPGAVFDPKLAAKKSAHWNMRLEAQRKSSQFVNEDSDDDEVTKTTTANLNTEGETAPSTIANDNVESEHEVQSDEGEPDLPEPPKKVNKSKSKHAHDEDTASPPIKEAPSSSAAPKKSKEERKREKKERREKERQEQIEEEAQDDKAARKERKRKKKEEEKKRKRLEEEERLASDANDAASSDAEPPKKKKSKKQKQVSAHSPVVSAEPSRSVVEESPSPASPASNRSATGQDVIDETDSDGGDDNSSEVNVKYETDSDEL
jgi:hypothetical protein